jgi:predicted Zn-dependent protease
MKLTGENQKADRWRRCIRCGITLLLVEVGFWGLWKYWRNNDIASGALYLAMMLPLAFIWVGCLSEMLARTFNSLFDPEDHREFDGNQTQRDLDAIARLVKNGHKDAAIQLCQRLKESGDASVQAMETMLEHLGVPQHSAQKPKPLNEASRLRLQGKFAEAETLLKTLLLQNPANVEAAMLLIRLYAQDLRRMDLALKVLETLEQQPHVSRGHTDFARRSISEWCQGKTKPEKVQALPESIDELLAQRYFGTALEILEQKTREQPRDFDSWLKLAEVHAVHCDNASRAEKIIHEIAANPAFSPAQIQSAKTKLKEWRDAPMAGSGR